MSAGRALSTAQKQEALKKLAEKRKQARMAGYATLADFHDGIYECDYVSPWSKSAHNVDADVMIVGHDWSSEVWMAGPIDQQSAERGYSDKFPTNTNLFSLLNKHFGLKFCQVYATNAFPFVKKGRAQGGIDANDMKLAVQEFLLPQFEIIRPIIAICLGKATFNAVRSAKDLEKVANLDAAINSHFSQSPEIHAVAHTGSRTMNMRGRENVDFDWAALRRCFDELRG